MVYRLAYTVISRVERTDSHRIALSNRLITKTPHCYLDDQRLLFHLYVWLAGDDDLVGGVLKRHSELSDGLEQRMPYNYHETNPCEPCS